MSCDDLLIGGTLSGSGITGGMSINGTALSVADWSDILGHAGYRKTPIAVSGRPGARVVGEGLPKPRFFTLNLNVGRLDANGTLVGNTPDEQLLENTDAFLAAVADPAGKYLEIVLADTTKRFLYIYSPDPGSVFQPRRNRQIRVPVVADWGYWRASPASTDTLSGADTAVVGGTVNVYDPVFVFAGDGTLSTSEWSLTIAGSSGAVTVDVGARTVTEAGNRADELLTITDRRWAWFTPGNNSVNASVSVGATWRSQWP